MGIVVVGDVILLLAFAVIGRWSHHEFNAGELWGVLGTAAPFLVGWAMAAVMLGAYERKTRISLRFSLKRLLVTWPVALALALVIRSIVEHEIPAFAFVLVALVFNLLTFSLWRVLVFALPRLRSYGIR